MDLADIREYLLTATRSARKTLDLDAPVDLADIRECPAIRCPVAEVVALNRWDDPPL